MKEFATKQQIRSVLTETLTDCVRPSDIEVDGLWNKALDFGVRACVDMSEEELESAASRGDLKGEMSAFIEGYEAAVQDASRWLKK